MKWAIREAVDVYFKAKSTFKLGARTIRAGEPVLIFDTVKTSTFEVASEMSYVTGGRGNARLLSYEGDKNLTFTFEDALLSNEGLAILSGADLIPARNKHLAGSHPKAQSVVAHYTEKYSIAQANISDDTETSGSPSGIQVDTNNKFPQDTTIHNGSGIPRGAKWNVWFTKKPYVGQNSSIYAILLDDAGEMSGAPLQIDLNSNPGKGSDTYTRLIGISKWQPNPDTSATAVVDSFIAFDINGVPIGNTGSAGGARKVDDATWNTSAVTCAEYDDQVGWYADYASVAAVWTDQYSNYGDIANYKREITATEFGTSWGDVTTGKPTKYPSTSETKGYYSYLLAPSGGVAQPKAYREGSQFVYKANVPVLFYQDIVLLDYYIEYQHDATQVSILPDKFAPFMYVEGSSLVRRASDGADLPVNFVIPKFKVTTALTFNLQSTGDASTFTFKGDALTGRAA